jgi:hypothetical protein
MGTKSPSSLENILSSRRKKINLLLPYEKEQSHYS